MPMKNINYFLLIIALPVSCNFLSRDKGQQRNASLDDVIYIDSVKHDRQSVNIKLKESPSLTPDTLINAIDTKKLLPEELVEFAKSLVGTPYKYASSDPALGFDCSGFITYVFNHFNIKVPRSSIDFTNVGIKIQTVESRLGDIILFTGTDSTNKSVGHMGIIISNKKDSIQFIHSSSGKANGVVISPLANYYRSRFLKVIRVFKNVK